MYNYISVRAYALKYNISCQRVYVLIKSGRLDYISNKSGVICVEDVVLEKLKPGIKKKNQ